MDFIEHTLSWCKGEIFEGKVFGLYGLGLLIASFLFWKMASTPFGKAMFIPFLLLGLLMAATGIYLITENNKRLTEYPLAFQENPTQFIQNEKQRADDFIKWYPITLSILSGVAVVGLACFLFWGGVWGRTLGLGLVMLALSGMFLDHFSEERAGIYYSHISEALLLNP